MMTMHTPMPAIAIGVNSLVTESMFDMDLNGGLTMHISAIRTASTPNKRVEVFFRSAVKMFVLEAVL
jgi:hypothetical protein